LPFINKIGFNQSLHSWLTFRNTLLIVNRIFNSFAWQEFCGRRKYRLDNR
jgi:hypothetical protein